MHKGQQALPSADYEYERKRKLIKYVEQLLLHLALSYRFTFSLLFVPHHCSQCFGFSFGSAWAGAWTDHLPFRLASLELDLVFGQGQEAVESKRPNCEGRNCPTPEASAPSPNPNPISISIPIPVTIELAQRSAQLQLQQRQQCQLQLQQWLHFKQQTLKVKPGNPKQSMQYIRSIKRAP